MVEVNNWEDMFEAFDSLELYDKVVIMRDIGKFLLIKVEDGDSL